jgi:hypothetical protein
MLEESQERIYFCLSSLKTKAARQQNSSKPHLSMSNHFGLMRCCAFALSLASVFSLRAQVTNCGITVNAGPDQVFCAPGQSLQLNGSVTGSYLTAQWSPPTGLANPNALSTSATVNGPVSYNLTVRSLIGPNLVNNGDFSQGNTGFSSNYNLGTGGQWGPVSNPGTYGITTAANLVHSQFAPCTDHTGGGNMMVVNGATSPSNIWCQTVTVQPNTDYAFSAWFAVVATQNPSILRFTINNVTIGNNFTLPTVACEWTQFFRIWASGAATSAQICIANVSTFSAGNDFALDDISLRQVCVTTDTVAFAPANLNPAWTATGPLCENSPAIDLTSLLTTGSTSGGQWLLNGNPATTLNPATLGPGTHTLLYRVQLGNCNDELSRTLTVNALPSAGTPLPALQVCSGTAQSVLLNQRLSNADPGGLWTETSAVPTQPGAFNASAATLQTAALAPGSYTFQYRVSGTAPCPDATATVTVDIAPSPTADAGPDQSLDCVMRQVSIGGNSTIGQTIAYTWTSSTGGSVLQPDLGITDVGTPGTYILTVRNTLNNCQSADTVVVINLITMPAFDLVIQPVTCAGDADGSISVAGISGATMPYSFRLNGGASQATGAFNQLSSGTYTVELEDANGCIGEQQALLAEPPAISVELVSDRPVLPLGESTLLRVITNLTPDQIGSVIWLPAIPGCDLDCLSAEVSPAVRTDYAVIIQDANGCRDTAEVTIFIERLQRVYIPTAFSPDDNGVNDKLTILAGPEVARIVSFRIADRWGGIVFERQDFPPNDPNYGWDGRIRGRAAGSGVFAYMAEVELVDGKGFVLSGEVVIVR